MKSDLKRIGLTAKQVDVIHQLVYEGKVLDDILREKRISRVRYHAWLADQRFCDYLETCLDSRFREAASIIAMAAPYAAAKLLELVDCDKPETARKATLDIMKAPVKTPSTAQPESVLLRSGAGTNVNHNTFQIDESTGRKLLQQLAQPSDN